MAKKLACWKCNGTGRLFDPVAVYVAMFRLVTGGKPQATRKCDRCGGKGYFYRRGC